MNQSISPCKEVNFLPLRQSWPLWKIVSIRAAAGDAMGCAQLVEDKNIIHFWGANIQYVLRNKCVKIPG